MCETLFIPFFGGQFAEYIINNIVVKNEDDSVATSLLTDCDCAPRCIEEKTAVRWAVSPVATMGYRNQ
jgi:hypothetical protein